MFQIVEKDQRQGPEVTLEILKLVEPQPLILVILIIGGGYFPKTGFFGVKFGF